MDVNRVLRSPVVDHALAQTKAAATAIEQIANEIRRFERSLSDDEEAWVSMMGAGGGLLIQPHQLRAVGSDKIVIDGLDESGRRVRAIQHVSQINVALVAIPAEKPNRIGFGTELESA